MHFEHVKHCVWHVCPRTPHPHTPPQANTHANAHGLGCRSDGIRYAGSFFIPFVLVLWFTYMSVMTSGASMVCLNPECTQIVCFWLASLLPPAYRAKISGASFRDSPIRSLFVCLA